MDRLKFAAVAAVVAIAGVFAATSAEAVLVPPDPNVVIDKVTICHRTNANTHPYEIFTPDADGDVSGHADHTGPVWDPTLKAQHIKWGDIIPPFKFSGGDFPGLNFDAAGEAIFRNDCAPVTPPVQQFGTLAVTKAVVLPAVGTPVSGIPSGYTVHVECDDQVTSVNVTFPATGGAGTPAVITNIEAGSTCVVSELNTGSFPSGSTVGYTPLGANTTGVVVDANQNAAVTVTNTFPAATAPQQAVAAETATAPRFTG